MDINKDLANSLQKSVNDLTGEDIIAQVEIPADFSKGDLSSNVAMLAFAKSKKNNEAGANKYGTPMDLAQKIVEHLNSDVFIQKSFRQIETKEPGFINFYFSDQVIEDFLKPINKGFESISQDQEPNLIFEFGDPNPFKEPHIGHLRMFAVGESICRLIEQNGTKIIRANYQGDVGMHVAKAIWGISNLQFTISNFDNKTLDEKVELLARSYTKGAKAFEEDEKAKKEIIAINKKIYTKDPEIMEIWEKGRSLSLEYFEELYKRLGVQYEKYYFESETATKGLGLVKENSPEVFQVDQGAYIFKGEEDGLHTRVFINSEGNPTYEAKDLALAILKNQDFPNAKSMIMTANEQTEYFRVLLAALKRIDPKISEKTMHLSMGFVNLKEGKMSSRTGNVVGANWLLEETKKRLKIGFKEVSDSVLDDLSIGAVKWSMLRFSRESNISFSIEESVDLAGNSGPYMQYTYARICSLLIKSENKDFEAISVKNLDQTLIALARQVCQFESVKKTASEHFSPNFLTDYLFKLAQNFNGYYEKEKIIGSENEIEKLAVSKTVGNVLKQGLYLLGIASPDKI